jgi:hypothetical protein
MVAVGSAVAVACAVTSAVIVGDAVATVRLNDVRSLLIVGLVLLILVLLGSIMGGLAVGWVVSIRSRRTALRVDRDGVTLGRPAFPPGATVHVPWSAIDAVVVFERSSGHAGGLLKITVPMVGVRLARDAVRPDGIPGPKTFMGRVRRLDAGIEPWPADEFREVRGWRLDEVQLRDMVIRHANRSVFVDQRRPDDAERERRQSVSDTWLQPWRTGPSGGTWHLPSGGGTRYVGARGRSAGRHGRR